MLVTLGIAGAACSFSVAFLAGGPAPLLLILAALYGFSALGDSPVLSTAMTESVDAGSLGAALAVRSILGFGDEIGRASYRERVFQYVWISVGAVTLK